MRLISNVRQQSEFSWPRLPNKPRLPVLLGGWLLSSLRQLLVPSHQFRRALLHAACSSWVGATTLNIRAGLDGSICADGHSSMVGLAYWWFSRSQNPAHIVFWATRA
nr:putative integron gene cassette protein [uncultured bacterium]